MALDVDQPVLTITDAALEKIMEIRRDEEDPDGLGLRIEITGVRGIDYVYDLSFEDLADADPDDVSVTISGLVVMMPPDTIPLLQGATLDLPSIPGQSGLVIRDPNRPNPLGDLGKLELSGDLAEKVTQLLDQRIIPALAAHGGYAALVGVDDDNKVYVEMGGGCQGCSVSALTLQEGIQKAILDAIPEITEVVDVTDHEAGENPFYKD